MASPSEKQKQPSTLKEDSKFQTITLSVPHDYPPIENAADIRLPLHFQKSPGIQEVVPSLGDLGDAMVHVHKAIDKDLEKLFLKENAGVADFGLYVAPKEIMGEDTADGPQFYLFVFEEGCKGDWVGIDREVREIIGRHYEGSGMETPPVRYR